MIAVPAMNTTAALDPTDVPRVAAAHLAHMLELLVGSGDGLMLLHGADAADTETVEADFWRGFTGDTATGVAALVRFRALVEVFASRRLQSLLMHEGFVVLKAAFHVAAEIRLNTARGFSPQGLVWAVTAELATARRRPGVERGYADQIAA